MPKIKTHTGAKKRLDITKSGRLKRAKAYKSHILTKKSTKRKRSLRQGTYVAESDASVSRKLIPYK
ncbi:MAG: 50S ribosomal protein L35 [Clostridiales bacterium]|nr:50S ribosomal protein L35 [Clostridiales bacterium]